MPLYKGSLLKVLTAATSAPITSTENKKVDDLSTTQNGECLASQDQEADEGISKPDSTNGEHSYNAVSVHHDDDIDLDKAEDVDQQGEHPLMSAEKEHVQTCFS